jgi:hypothetical protein
VAVCVVWIDRADGDLSNGAKFVVFGAVLMELHSIESMSQKSTICDSSSEWVRLFFGSSVAV